MGTERQTTIVSKPKLKAGGTGVGQYERGRRTGTVTGGTATYTKKGDVFSATVRLAKPGAVSILKGTKVLL